MGIFDWMGLVSTISLMVPVTTLIITKLAWYKSFPALLFYYFFLLSYHAVLLGYIKMDGDFKYNHGIVNNLLGTPLTLLFFIYFCVTTSVRNKLLIAMLSFMAFEIIIMAIFGFTSKATTIILAPGLLMPFILSFIFFLQELKVAVSFQNVAGKTLMATALLFIYAGSFFVYVAFYLIDPIFKEEAHLIYFFTTILSSIIMTIGLCVERKLIRHLLKQKTTREQYNVIYKTPQTIAQFYPPFLDFDKK